MEQIFLLTNEDGIKLYTMNSEDGLEKLRANLDLKQTHFSFNKEDIWDALVAFQDPLVLTERQNEFLKAQVASTISETEDIDDALQYVTDIVFDYKSEFSGLSEIQEQQMQAYITKLLNQSR